MNIYTIHFKNGTHSLEAKDEADAKAKIIKLQKEAEKLEIDFAYDTSKILKIEKYEPPKPDNRMVKEKNGYYLPGWGIHIAAKSEKEAKKFMKDVYEKDIDKDAPPPKE